MLVTLLWSANTTTENEREGMGCTPRLHINLAAMQGMTTLGGMSIVIIERLKFTTKTIVEAEMIGVETGIAGIIIIAQGRGAAKSECLLPGTPLLRHESRDASAIGI